MCGISGILSSRATPSNTQALVETMLCSIKHRGPDSEGIYSDPKGSLHMGSVRLAMIDSLTETNWLANEDDSLILVYNGEIYNHPELRSKLEGRGHFFKTGNDGEVILHLYEERGPSLLEELDGMFAFVLWDKKRKTLLLARDPLGIKPLYYQKSLDRFAFASELKAITAGCLSLPPIDNEGISDYMALRFVPAPRTIFQGIHKLEPGSYLLVTSSLDIKVKRYWTPHFQQGGAEGSLGELLTQAVLSTKRSDHPLGLLLSGGLDSGSILAAATSDGSPLTSFTIGYDSQTPSDEGRYAQEIALAFRSPHIYSQIQSSDVESALLRVIHHLDEPVYSTVCLSTYALAKQAATRVRGVLTGDGSDELLLGYHYLLKPLEFAQKGGDWRGEYLRQIGWIPQEWEHLLLDLPSPSRGVELLKESQQTPLEEMRYFELRYRLPEYHLSRMDRLSMAHGLEARVPFLRKSIVNWALRTPAEELLVLGKQKEVLRQAFAIQLPRKTLQRKKQPFTAPFVHWMHGPLRGLISHLIYDTSYHHPLGFKKKGLEWLLQRSDIGDDYAASVLWGVINLYLWYDRYNTYARETLVNG